MRVLDLNGNNTSTKEGRMSSHEINDLLDENTELRQENARLREALKNLLSSQVLKEAPFYNYSEAVLRAREALKGSEE